MRPFQRSQSVAPNASAWVILALIGITALAAGLRLYQIDHLPPGLSYDEAWNDRQALRVVQGRAHPVYFADEWGDVEESLHIYLIAALFALTGPQAIGGRLVSAFLGALTVPLLFLATREMLRGPRVDPHPFDVAPWPDRQGRQGKPRSLPIYLARPQSALLRGPVIARARSARSNLSTEIASRPSGARNDKKAQFMAACSIPEREERIALLAALVLATLYWHVHYTRLGMEPPAVPALATLTFWLLWRAFNRGRWLDYGLAGSALGLSLYTHPSARFLPIIVALFVIWRWSVGYGLCRPASRRDNAGQISMAKEGRALIRREIPRVCLLVACALIIFAPLGFFFAQNPHLFFYRAGQASVVTFGSDLGQTLVSNTLKVIGGLIWRGDTNLRLNLPGRPGLDVVQLLLLALGVVYALGRERRRALVFPLLWAGIMLLPSILSDSAPHFGRMLGATPALAIPIALGLAQISNWRPEVESRTPEGREVGSRRSEVGDLKSETLAPALRTSAGVRNPKSETLAPALRASASAGVRNLKSEIGAVARIALALVAAGALVYSTVKMTCDYFVTWAHDPGLYTAFDVGLRQSAEYLASLPRDELISLSPVDRDLPVFRFTFRDDVSRLKTFNGRRCAVYPARPEYDWTHVAIIAEETYSLDALRRVFPSGQVARKFFDAGAPYAVAYRVKAGDPAQTPLGELAVFDDRIVLVNAETPGVLTSGVLTLTLSWTSRATLDTNYTIFVHLSTSLDAPPVAQEDAQPCDNSYPTTWWSPGEIIAENRRVVIPGDLPPGQYVLTAGIYDLATGKRLPARSSNAPPGDQFVLGVVTVAH